MKDGYDWPMREITVSINDDPEVVAELSDLAERIVTAAQLSERTDKQVAQDVFLGLPSDHYLLRSVFHRRWLDQMIKAERDRITKARQPQSKRAT